jgi:hypothetical protein
MDAPPPYRSITQRELCDERSRFRTAAELKAAFVGIPDLDYASLRADIDEYFGEDRIGDDDWAQ